MLFDFPTRVAAPEIALASALLALCPAAACAQAENVAFTDSRGCRTLVTEAVAARLREIAAQGSVTWDGPCKGGLIDGKGVLRQEGTVIEQGRTKRYAFHLTGIARDGVRIGAWRRETFNMYDGSTRYWTSASTIDYRDGKVRWLPKLLDVRSHEDFLPPFRKLLAEADNRLAGPRNETPGAALAGPQPAPPSKVRASAEAPSQGEARASGEAAPRDTPSTGVRPPPLIVGALREPVRPPVARTAAATATAAQVGNCSVDQINTKLIGVEPFMATSGAELEVVGWAADPANASVPDRAWVQLSAINTPHGMIAALPRNVDRPDVARALGDPRYARAGFSVKVSTRNFPPGDYILSVLQQVGPDVMVCALRPRVTLR